MVQSNRERLQRDLLQLKQEQVEIQHRLADKQIKAIDEAQSAKKKADVRASMKVEGQYVKVVLRNAGQGTAHNLDAQIDRQKGKSNSELQAEIDRKLPTQLVSGDSLTLHVGPKARSLGALDAKIWWDNEDEIEDRWERVLHPE